MSNRMKKIISPVCAVGLALNNVPNVVLVNAVESTNEDITVLDKVDELEFTNQPIREIINNESILENMEVSDLKENENVEYVAITDKNLLLSINEALNKSDSASLITIEELLSIEKLDLSGKEIENLDGLERAVNLIELNLSDNSIVNLNPISFLNKLEVLDISDNNISDISPLKDLTSLKELNLSNIIRKTTTELIEDKNNKIQDLSILSNLNNLTSLNLANNIVVDISPLLELNQLVKLDLSGNSIIDISKIKNMKSLEILRISNQLIEKDSIKVTDSILDMEYNVKDENNEILIPNMISREGIYEDGFIKWNKLDGSTSNLTVIFDKEILLKENTTAYFSGKIVQNVEVDKVIDIEDKNLLSQINIALDKEESNSIILKSEIESIETLVINDNNIKSIKGLENAINLKELTIRNTSIEDFTALSGLYELRKLDLMDNNIKTVEFLKDLDNIEYLNLQGNEIISINSIDGRLPLLKELNASFNNLYSVDLNNLNNLIKLDLSNNHISTVSGMEDINLLEDLNLDKNNIGDISLLSNLENLAKLSLQDQVVYLPALKHAYRTFNIENTIVNIDGSIVNPTIIYGNGEVKENLISWQDIDDNAESLEFEFSSSIENQNGLIGNFSGKVIQPIEIELFSEQGYLDISLSTNQIKFENFTGLEDVEIIKAIEMNVDSDKAYDIYASIPSLIRNSDGNKELDSTVLSIKESNSPDYISFPNLNENILLIENIASGVNTHTFDFKLNKDKFLEKDSYRAVIRFEVNQK